MGYFAGSASTPADLIAAIVAACVADGWTESGGVISKGDVHTRLTVESANIVKVQGANDSGFTDICPWDGYVEFRVWPITYRIFTNTDPDACFAHIRDADHVNYQFIMFGMIENKVGDWVGGNFFSAARNLEGTGGTFHNGVFTGGVGTAVTRHGAPFASGGSSAHNQTSPDGLHIEGFGTAYKWADSSVDYAGVNHVEWPRFLNPLNVYEENLWNDQAVMLHPHLYLAVADGRWSRVGTLPHMRSVRIKNYEAYDIITLGEEQWMVAPWVYKDTAVPQPPSTADGTSGTHGVAVRYTP